MFELRDVGMTYGNQPVLAGVDARLARNSLVTIVGPNGAGKSTLMAILMGLRHGYSGQALLDGKPVDRWLRAAFARRVSFVPQNVRIDFPFTAEQVVLMGRSPHGDGMFEVPADREAVREAMQLTDTLPFASRDFRSLSGGERQRVILAAALAQTPEALLLDEPTTFLDLKHQIAIFRLLQDRARSGLLVLTVTHDINLAAMYSDRVLVLSAGRLVADGAPQAALTTETMNKVFEVHAEIVRASDGANRIIYGG
jgi:iron complex transport system ATP-binding protein